jgi:arsenite-transporting ATPase
LSLDRLSKTSLQFVLFGGKGGVGKTTMAAAAALELAKTRRVLVFTTDPSPSLADSFGQEIGNEPTAIVGQDNLYAMEINASKVLKEFQAEHGSEILDILREGTYLEDEESEELFHLEIPGLDEVMSFKKIMDFIEHSDYQLYLVDTAPTGHTLRLLTLPDLLDNWIKYLATLRWKYHVMVRHFAKQDRTERADAFLMDMKKTVKRVKELLQNAQKTEFVVVTIAEKMAVAETEDLIASLKQMHVPSHHIIINNVFPEDDCDFMRRRRAFQEKHIHTIKKHFASHQIIEVFLQPEEIYGKKRLETLGAQLFAHDAREEE